MGLSIYLNIVKINFLKNLTYPTEVVAYIVRYIVRVLFLIALWSVISKTLSTPIDQSYLISYFMLSTGISDLIMSDNTNLGRSIRKAVARGHINNVLIKPVNTIVYYYAESVGTLGIKFFLAFFSIFIAIILNPPQSILSVLLFIILFIEAFFIAFAYNLFEGALSLIFTEVGGIKNALHHITRVLSGQSAPFSFFPEFIRNILILTPIPAMVYGPINGLNKNSLDLEIVIQLIAGFVWAIILNYLVIRFWKFCIKKYDAAGN